jgi:hypothetical protein
MLIKKKKLHCDSISPQSDWQLSRKQATTNAGEDVGKNQPLYTVGGNVTKCNYYGNQSGGSSKD